jgi:hypothetical protein
MVKREKKTRKRKIKGGMGELKGLPFCTNLSQFQITDEQILNFKSIVTTSPMDCFINALQILGYLDTKTSNIMRISSAGRTGFLQEEIEKIFIVLQGYNFDFKSTSSPAEFSSWITSHLLPGHVVFAGYEGQTNHVYLIGRFHNGQIVYIDPQLGTLCDLTTAPCIQYISQQPILKLLFNSPTKLTPDNLKAIGFHV